MTLAAVELVGKIFWWLVAGDILAIGILCLVFFTREEG
jgi:hypothetical protein